MLQQQRFEILFEIGAHAILDGYYREAVSSFTSSLERFYEFAIRVSLEITPRSDTLFQTCWKEVSNQSERQLGAFIFLWASVFGTAPELLKNPQIAFRNRVIHKGMIPTREEAISYGDHVLAVLGPQIIAIQTRFPDEVAKVTFSHLRESQSESDQGRTVSKQAVRTIVSLTFAEPGHYQKSLDEHLGQLLARR